MDEILDQALALLQRRGRLTYRALQRQFNLDEAYLADLRMDMTFWIPQAEAALAQGH